MQNENSCLTHIFTVAGSSIGELPLGSYATLFSLPIAIKFGCKHRSSNAQNLQKALKLPLAAPHSGGGGVLKA